MRFHCETFGALRAGLDYGVRGLAGLAKGPDDPITPWNCGVAG